MKKEVPSSMIRFLEGNFNPVLNSTQYPQALQQIEKSASPRILNNLSGLQALDALRTFDWPSIKKNVFSN
jgi:hypothetical protein